MKELKISLLNIRLLSVKIQNKIYDLSKGCNLILRREEKNEGIKNFAIRYSSALGQTRRNLLYQSIFNQNSRVKFALTLRTKEKKERRIVRIIKKKRKRKRKKRK